MNLDFKKKKVFLKEDLKIVQKNRPECI